MSWKLVCGTLLPKVTTLITFGFNTLLLSLLSGGRYFQRAMCAPHGHFKKCERYTFWKKEMYALYFKSCEWECQIIIINKPQISVALVHQIIYHIQYFCQKGKYFWALYFQRVIRHYFRGYRYFRDSLTPVTFYRYFRGVVTFGTLR